MIKRFEGAIFICAVVLFIVAIIGMATDGSSQWVQSAEEAGWICFILLIVASYLIERGPGFEGAALTTPEKVAWGFAGAAIACQLVAIVANLAKKTNGWVEAVEMSGTLCTLVLILLAVTVRRGRIKQEAGQGQGQGSTGPAV